MLRVLYVCVHNAGRSQMAEAFTNHFAKVNNLPVLAESAGTHIAESINPLVVEAMEEIGISMSGHSPKLLSSEMTRNADKVISMGCGVNQAECPALFLLHEDWQLEDPNGQDLAAVRIIRDQIQTRVRALLEESSNA